MEPFGKTSDGKEVQQFVLENDNGVTIKIITRGATWRSAVVPDRAGNKDDVLLGFDTVEGYESDANQYFGVIAGRVANRIADGQFTLNGKTYELFTNDGDNTLHGGNGRSLDKVIWEGKEVESDDGAAAEFSYTSPDGEEGFPGSLQITVRYTLTDEDAVRIEYKATTDKDTPVNLTNHAYFNLSGHGAETVLDHKLTLAADRFTPTDDELIPTGEIKSVEGTPLDFRTATVIGERIEELVDTAAMGYDHNLILVDTDKEMQTAAALEHPSNGRLMTVYTDQPAIQFYSGNFLFGQEGKEGKTYALRSALCLETQHYPDSVHHDNFPSIILAPGETYTHTTIYDFDVQE